MTTLATPPEAEFSYLGTGDPDETTPGGSSTWYFRGHNFVLAYTTLVAGDVLEQVISRTSTSCSSPTRSAASRSARRGRSSGSRARRW